MGRGKVGSPGWKAGRLDRSNQAFLPSIQVDLGYFPYSAFQIDPLLDPVRDDPEFQRIMLRAKSKHEAFKAKHFGG